MTTVQQCWDHYAQHHLPNTVQSYTNGRYWGRLKWFATMMVDALTPMEVDRYVASRVGVMIATINRELSLLRAALRHAERHQLIGKAPFVKSLPGAAVKMRALDRDEVARLLVAADKGNWRERVYVRLGLGTAARPGAIVGLQWSQVLRADGIIDYRVFDQFTPRRKRRAVVPINKMVSVALKEAWLYRDGDYVLHWNGRALSSPRPLMRRVAERAGILDCAPHVLRHTAASLLLQDEVDLLKVSRLLGHSSSRITEQVYFQHQPPWLKDAVEKLSF